LSNLSNQLSEELPMFGWMKVSLHSFFYCVFSRNMYSKTSLYFGK
jgi:hypothetical protein